MAKCLDDHIGVFDCLLDLMHILLVLFIQLRKISLYVHQLLCQIKVIFSFVLTSRPNCLNLRLDAFNISDARLDLKRLCLHNMPHLLKQLFGLSLHDRNFLLSFSQLRRRNDELLLIAGVRHFPLHLFSNSIDLKSKLCLLVFCPVCTKLGILHPIAHQIDF